MPDGRLIYTLPEPDGFYECNYWEMRLDARTGRPIGEPKRLTKWAGSCMAGSSATADGKRLAFVKQTLRFTGYLTDLEAGGTRIANTRHFTLTDSRDMPLDWTADSKAVIVLSDRTGPWGIYKQLLAGEPAELIVTGTAGFGSPRVSPDGNWILYRRDEDASKGMDIMRVPINGGSPQVIFTARPGNGFFRARSPSSLCAIAEPSEDRKQVVITAFDPVKGRGQELTRFDIDPNTGFWNLDSPRRDPDRRHPKPGRPNPDSLLAGTTPQEIKVKGWRDLLSVSWAADGKGLFAFNGPQGSAVLLHVDLQGNARVLWKSHGNGGPGQGGPFPSPDGRHLAMLDCATESNFWLMENF